MKEYMPYGEEQPYIKAGPFKIRLPFIHYRFEIADYIQGLLMCAVCLGAIPMLQEYLGMPFNVALAIVILNGFLYTWHTLLGDPVVPGWITPAIPLLVAYCLTFAEGQARMQALCAFEITLGVFAIILGLTGAAGKLISLIPPALKSGIILGAGISAIYMIFCKGGKYEALPITTIVCLVVAFYLLFSNSFKKLSTKNKFFSTIANLGILPAVLIAVIVAPIVGETGLPNIQWSFSHPDFATLWTDWVPWGNLGWPSLMMFIKSIPTVISIYIVLFGDVVQSKALVKDADITRPDEKVDYNPNRAHLIFGIRNTIMGCIGPDITMCGPLWAAMQVVVCERYKKGKKSMGSIFGGAACFRFGTFTGYWLMPIVSLVQPILNVALSLTMVVQGFVSVRIGVQQCRSFKDLGIAGCIAGVILAKSSAWGLAVGIVACLLCYGKDFFKGDTTFGHLWSKDVEAMIEDESELSDDASANQDPEKDRIA
ncbi:MAG: solute carrier family 23 protein [Eubacteriaceae bacterium]|nr:solute carrier family 23 protein [Eubacteriaceae bacterium]